MYKQEEIKPYAEQGDKGELVEKMFDNIAPTYDVLIIVFRGILISVGDARLLGN